MIWVLFLGIAATDALHVNRAPIGRYFSDHGKYRLAKVSHVQVGDDNIEELQRGNKTEWLKSIDAVAKTKRFSSMREKEHEEDPYGWDPLHKHHKKKDEKKKNTEVGREPALPHPDNLCMDGRVAPEFFLLGVPKSSTSSFASELFQSSGIAHYELDQDDKKFFFKEPHIFDSEERFGKGKAWWLSHYPRCDAQAPKRVVSTDCTPDYFEKDDAPQRIADFYGEQKHKLKFMVLLREPVTRAYSEFSMGKQLGWWEGQHKGEKMSFTTYLTSNILRDQDPLEIIEHSAYPSFLEKWLNVFPAEQFTIVPYQYNVEKRKGEPSLARSVMRSLGVEVPAEPEEELHLNRGKHVALEENVEPSLLKEVRERISHRMGAKAFAEVAVANKGVKLHGFKGERGNTGDVAAWLQSNW